MRSVPESTVADLRGGAGDAPPPPRRPKFLHFHAFFGENSQNHRLAPREFAPPPRGNPGSATDLSHSSSLKNAFKLVMSEVADLRRVGGQGVKFVYWTQLSVKL